MSYIKLDEVEKKIKETLNELDVPATLSSWMFSTLREEFRTEQELQTQTKENLQQAFMRYNTQLSNLFDMRMNGEIGSNEYEVKKTEITILKEEAYERLQTVDNRLEKWLTNAENDFNWSKEAIDLIDGDDLPAKRIVLQKLSEETTLQTVGIDIKLSPLFKLVRRTQEVVKSDVTIFEPNNIHIEKRPKGYFERLPILMGCWVDRFRTINWKAVEVELGLLQNVMAVGK